jgi:hypothetical protein
VAGVIALPFLAGAMFLVAARVPRRAVGGSAPTVEVAAPIAPVAAPVTLSATPTVASVAAPPPPAPEDDLEMTAVLRTENAPPNRDVFLDGATIGRTPLRAVVPCGPHTLQMVAGAPKQPIELPCGGERVVRYDARGRWSLR